MFQAFLGAIVSRAAESAVDSFFGAKDSREASKAPYGQSFVPGVPGLPEVPTQPTFGSDTAGDSRSPASMLMEEFIRHDTNEDSERYVGFIDDPLLSALASGRQIEPVDFLRVNNRRGFS